MLFNINLESHVQSCRVGCHTKIWRAARTTVVESGGRAGNIYRNSHPSVRGGVPRPSACDKSWAMFIEPGPEKWVYNTEMHLLIRHCTSLSMLPRSAGASPAGQPGQLGCSKAGEGQAKQAGEHANGPEQADQSNQTTVCTSTDFARTHNLSACKPSEPCAQAAAQAAAWGRTQGSAHKPHIPHSKHRHQVGR
jgi:hypothetical protein